MEKSEYKKRFNYKSLFLSVVLLFFSLASVGGGIYALKHVENSVKNISTKTFPILKNVSSLSVMHKRIKEIVYRSFVTKPEKREDVLDEFHEYTQNTMRHLNEIQAYNLNFEISTSNFLHQSKKVIFLALDGKKEEAQKHLDFFNQSFESLSFELEKLGEFIHEEANAQIKNIQTQSEDFMLVGLFFLGFGVLLAPFFLYVSVFKNHHVMKNLSFLTNKLGKELDQSQSKSNTVSGISEILTKNIKLESEHMSDALALCEETSSLIERNSEKLKKSSSFSDQYVLIAQRTKDKSKKMVDSISLLNKSHTDTIQQIQVLNHQVTDLFHIIQNIAPKTKNVNDLFYQAKMLYLNATTEAVKAGEQGKGFAMLAEDLGGLALAIGKAAGEITEVLNISTKKIAEVVRVNKGVVENLIPDSKEKMEVGLLNVKKYAHELDEVLGKVSQSNDLILELVRSFSEQSRSVNEISKCLTKVDKTSRLNESAIKNFEHSFSEFKILSSQVTHSFTEINYLMNGLSLNELSSAPKDISIDNVLPIKKITATEEQNSEEHQKKIVGMDFDVSIHKK